MFLMERMKKVELLVLKRDVDGIMRYLGSAGCLQLHCGKWRADRTHPGRA